MNSRYVCNERGISAEFVNSASDAWVARCYANAATRISEYDENCSGSSFEVDSDDLLKDLSRIRTVAQLAGDLLSSEMINLDTVDPSDSVRLLVCISVCRKLFRVALDDLAPMLDLLRIHAGGVSRFIRTAEEVNRVAQERIHTLECELEVARKKLEEAKWSRRAGTRPTLVLRSELTVPVSEEPRLQARMTQTSRACQTRGGKVIGQKEKSVISLTGSDRCSDLEGTEKSFSEGEGIGEEFESDSELSVGSASAESNEHDEVSVKSSHRGHSYRYKPRLVQKHATVWHIRPPKGSENSSNSKCALDSVATNSPKNRPSQLSLIPVSRRPGTTIEAFDWSRLAPSTSGDSRTSYVNRYLAMREQKFPLRTAAMRLISPAELTLQAESRRLSLIDQCPRGRVAALVQLLKSLKILEIELSGSNDKRLALLGEILKREASDSAGPSILGDGIQC